MLKRSLNRRELGNIRRLHRLRRFCFRSFGKRLDQRHRIVPERRRAFLRGSHGKPIQDHLAVAIDISDVKVA
jgi:hypothetical protein